MVTQWTVKASSFLQGETYVSDQTVRLRIHCTRNANLLLYVHSGFAIIFMEKKELVALLSLSSWYLVIVVWLFLAVS